MSSTVTEPSRGWHKGACQTNGSWSRAEAALPDSKVTFLRLHNTTKFKVQRLHTPVTNMPSAACDQPALLLQHWCVPPASSFMLRGCLAMHSSTAGKQQETASFRESRVWMRHKTGTVCIRHQLATWDPENISFNASSTHSDFIFKFFFFLISCFQQSESKTVVGQKGKNKQTKKWESSSASQLTI